MIAGLIGALFGKKDAATGGYARLNVPSWPAALYAIGDVHGCLNLLKATESLILDDARGMNGEAMIVCVGDLVDRGPDSRGVIDHLMSPMPAGFRRLAVMGNHEAMMLEFLDTPDLQHPWLRFGGIETLASYGLYDLSPRKATLAAQLSIHVPEEHVAYLRSLPVMIKLPGLCLVHAGMRSGIDPERQTDRDLLWIRSPEGYVNPKGGDWFVVHGHTPVKQPKVSNCAMNIDTGAYDSGILTCVKFGSKNDYKFLSDI